MKMKNTVTPRGRPRTFDVGEALDRALQVFWDKGYEGASLTDLTRAMGISRPSLYAAFGDKQSLFRKVLDRYAEGPAAYVSEALKEPTARAVVARLLNGAVCTSTAPRQPQGCLTVHGALVSGKDADAIREELSLRRAAGEAAIRKRLQRARREGDLPSDADPADLARYITTVMHGMAVQAAGGASRAQLQRVAQTALRAFPA
jgi:AcrR family transcriptional regulator